MKFAGFSALKCSPWYKRLISAFAVFVIYLLVGFLALPPLIKWQMLKRLPAITKRQAAIRQVKFNPLTLSLTIRGLALTEPDGRRFASWEELYLNFQTSSLFRWAWTFKEIRLVEPFGQVILFKDGKLNFANMFVAEPPAAPAPPARESGVLRLNIFSLLVTNGYVAFEDQTRRSPFHTLYRPINLTLNHFSTRPGIDTPYSFRAESDAGRSITWAGDLSVQPLRSAGHLEVTGVNLSRAQPYLEDFTRALLTNGVADVQMTYRFAAGTNGLDLLVTNGVIHAEQLQLLDPDTGETVAGLRSFDIRQAQLNWRARDVRLGEVKVAEAALLARLKPGGHLNLLDLLSLPQPSTNPAPAQAGAPVPWTASVDDFAIENAAVKLEDLTRRTPFKSELKPIEVSVSNFTTRAESDARYSFHLASESEETFEGSGALSINPVRSAGEVKAGAVNLKKYLPYAEDFFRGQVTGGQLAVDAPYTFALATNGVQAAVSNLALTVTALEVKPADSDESVTHVDRFALRGVAADLQEHRARVGEVDAEGGSLLVRRLKDGSINLLGLLAAGPTNSAAAPPDTGAAAGTNAWVVNVDEVALKNYTVKIEDQQPARPAAFLLDQMALNLKNASTVTNTPIALKFASRFNETGTIAAEGTVRVAPVSADLQLNLTNLDLRAVQSYLEQYVRLGIVSGGFGTFGRAQYQAADPSLPQIRFAGNVSLTNFVSTDQVGFKEFVRWDLLDLSGIDCELQPNRLKVDEVRCVGSRASLLIGADRRPNLSLIFTNAAAAPVSTAASATTAPAAGPATVGAFPIQVATVRLDKATLAFTDESLQPHATIGLQELSGTIKGLSSALNTTADVDLAGKVDQQSPFTVAGRINPLASDLFVDLVVSNANTQLTPLTPYMEKYAGYPLNKGRLTTALRYQVQGKELKAENKIQIEHLTLGARNNSPDATSLPVKLAVALLKDSEGRIELNLPLHGRIDDPQFSLGPIVLKVLLNTIAKAVASPFKLLGALVGGGEELSFIDFVPGSTNLVEGEADKLAKLTKALAQRPALSLEIEGAIDPLADRDALAKAKLRDQFKAKRLQELSARGKAPQSAETFELAPDDYDQLLRAAFAEKFGTNVAAVLSTNALALAATNQPAAAKTTSARPKPPFYKRPLMWVGLSQHTRRSPAEKRLTKADRLALSQAPPDLMETLVAAQVPVTDEDYRALMTARARWIQDWLVQNGQVAADRLLLIAPKPVDGAYRGESRANLSLD